MPVLAGSHHHITQDSQRTMILASDLRRLVSVAAPFLVVALSACDGASAPSHAAAAEPEVAYDHGLTDTALVLAGKMPEDEARFRRVIDRPSWKAHAVEFDANWARNEQNRFGLMRKWRDQEFGPLAETCGTLFYPFGGPDALNAILLFPKCDTYLLFGLEPPGTIPALNKLPDQRLDDLMVEMRQSMADIFQRNYFITSRMMKDLHKPEVDGNMTPFLVFLARLNARVVGIDTEGPWKEWGVPGMTIRFVMPGSDRIQSLTYIKVNMEDQFFSKKTGLVSYLKGLGTVTTFVKSASYLMHDDRFSIVRSIVINQSRLLLQDDSGIPYRFFKGKDWEVSLYGHYRKPVKDFNYGFQTDLDAVYKKPGVPKPLPFSFGYHWGDGGSSVMLMVRKPPSAGQ